MKQGTRQLAEGVDNCVVLLREIRAQGYAGGYTILKEFVKPYETEPGEQAQVDFGCYRYLTLDGQEHWVWAFVCAFLVPGHVRGVRGPGRHPKLHSLSRPRLGALRWCRLREERKVGRDAFVRWGGSWYGVPWPWAGRTVQIQADQTTVQIFVRAHDLVEDLRRAQAEGRLDRRLRVYLAPKVLIIDEFGVWPCGREGATALFALVSARYERGSIILTANKGFAEWGEVLGDEVVATAILDRLLHYSYILNIRAESYRLREKRRAGLFGRAPGRSAEPVTEGAREER